MELGHDENTLYFLAISLYILYRAEEMKVLFLDEPGMSRIEPGMSFGRVGEEFWMNEG